MSEASKDPKRESLKRRAELLKQELSAAITSRDVTSAVGILKKLQGMPSEFVPADLSSLAEQLKSEISSNSALGSESAAEAARKAKEEEERKEREKAIYDIRSTLSDIEKYFESEATKNKHKLFEEVVAQGKDASKEKVKEAMSVFVAGIDEELEQKEKLIMAEKKLKEVQSKADRLPRDSEERRGALQEVQILDEHVSRGRVAADASRESNLDFLLSPPVINTTITLNGKDVTGREMAAMYFGAEAIQERGVEGRVDLRGQAKEAASPKAKQATAEIQTAITTPISTATSEKIATSLTEGAVRASNLAPPPTPSSPKVIRNRNNPRTKQ